MNFDTNLRMPVWIAYSVFLVYALAAGKVHTLLGSAMTALPVLLLIYTGISGLANWDVRSRWMIAYPYYSLLRSTFMPFIGAWY